MDQRPTYKIKLLEENKRINHCDLRWANGFLTMTPNVQTTKEIRLYKN